MNYYRCKDCGVEVHDLTDVSICLLKCSECTGKYFLNLLIEKIRGISHTELPYIEKFFNDDIRKQYGWTDKEKDIVMQHIKEAYEHNKPLSYILQRGKHATT